MCFHCNLSIVHFVAVLVLVVYFVFSVNISDSCLSGIHFVVVHHIVAKLFVGILLILYLFLFPLFFSCCHLPLICPSSLSSFVSYVVASYFLNHLFLFPWQMYVLPFQLSVVQSDGPVGHYQLKYPFLL